MAKSFFAVCFLVADGKELLCRQLADGKELADGKLADSSSGSINCPTIICLPIVCYFSQEKPLVKPTAPGSCFSYICLAIYFSVAFLFRSIKPKKYKNTLLRFIFIYFIWRSIYQSTTIYLTSVCLSWGVVPRKGLTTPFKCRVARCCCLCAGAVYVVLLGSPTGSITLVSSVRKIPTFAVLHHPLLFREIPT